MSIASSPTDPVTIQAGIVAEFTPLADWDAKYAHIIALGKAVPPMDEALKTEDNIVRGCQSLVWLHATEHPEYKGRIQLQADSDALIVKGLISLLLRVYHNQTPATILATPPQFLTDLDLGKHLSMTRSNGLHAMLKQIQFYAMAFQAKASLG